MKNEKRIEIRILFNRNDNLDTIGWDTLVKTDEIDSSKKIETRMRNGFPVKYTKGVPVPTMEMNMIFEYLEDNFQLITLFPGKYAPPFPDKELQTKEEYEEYADFWDNHLFLVP